MKKVFFKCNGIFKTIFSTQVSAYLCLFPDEKKKTKKIDSELNPVWNEVNLSFCPYNVGKSTMCVIGFSQGPYFMTLGVANKKTVRNTSVVRFCSVQK